MVANNITEEMNLTKPGDHMVLLYDDENVESNANVIASYIISRIIKNKKCFYISGDINEEVILNKLKSSIELEEVIRKGQLSILKIEDAYSKEKINLSKIMTSFKDFQIGLFRLVIIL